MSEAYGLSLLAILGALSLALALVRAESAGRAVLLWVCIAGVFGAGLVAGHLWQPADDPWVTAGQVRAQTPVVVANSGNETLAAAVPSDRGLRISKGGQISVDIFDEADKAIPGQLDLVRLPKGKRLTVAGWAADSKADGPCKALFVTVGKARLDIPYGLARADVAAYYHDPAYMQTGFNTQIPIGTLAKGTYRVTFECLASGDRLFVTDHPRVVVVE